MNFTSRQYSKYNNAERNDGQRNDGQRNDGQRNQRNDGQRNQRNDGQRNQRNDGQRNDGQRNDGQRNDGQRRPAPFCPICKKNGRPESEYNSHFIRETSDENSPITCPLLLNMECNHCGEKGHIVAKCPYKKCVYCNEPGHTVSRCTAAPKEAIDQFLDQRHQSYVNREQRRDNVFQRHAFALAQAPAPPPAPSITSMFEDAPSLSKKPVKTVSAPTVSYSVVAEIAAPLAAPKKKVVEEKEEEYEDDSDDEYIENNDDSDSVHSITYKQPVCEEEMTLSQRLATYYDNNNHDEW